MTAVNEVYRAIPHRPPFLFVDAIDSISAEKIVTRRTLRADESYFQGHYPGNPIMPGVLLCESVFQSGAIFLVRLSEEQGRDCSALTPVLTRIRDARFRRIIRPGEELTIEATLSETLGGFFFLRGSVTVEGKRALTLDFGLALTAAPAAVS